MLDVKEGGSVTFTGKFDGTGVENVRSMFYNAGTIERGLLTTLSANWPAEHDDVARINYLPHSMIAMRVELRVYIVYVFSSAPLDKLHQHRWFRPNRFACGRFKDDALFQDNGNVFRSNSGTIK